MAIPKVLIACEESQTVTIQMRKHGLDAYSCDILPCSGGHPEWHIQTNVVPLLDQQWDLIVAFPPCTHLAVSGAAWFKQKQEDGRQKQGIDFFMLFAHAQCSFVGIENPIGIMSSVWRKPDQIIHPYEYGHAEKKSTCLWLKGLPKLVQTNNVYDEMIKMPKSKQERIHWLGPSSNRLKLRSKTYDGIAEAMAVQWGNYIKRKKEAN